MDWRCCLNYALLSFIKYILSFYFLMSDTYTYPRTVPELVQDVSLKRARVELESGETAIRTTSGSSTDVTAISNALGQQTDPASEASVIGLLKNLIANSGGGGGGGSSTYPVFKCSHGYSNISLTTGANIRNAFFEDKNYQTAKTFPDWVKFAAIIPLNINDSSPMVDNYFSISLGETIASKNMFSVITLNTDLANQTLLCGMELLFENIRFNAQELYIPAPSTKQGYALNVRAGGEPTDVTSSMTVMNIELFLFDTDPLEISDGGGGSGGTVETYNLTINNVSATNITAPISSPPSADDQTLASKAYVDSQVTSKSLSYQPVSEQQLNIYTSYSIASLLGQATWDFPFSGGGSMDFVFSYSSAPSRDIWYRCHVPLPSYLNPQNTPKIHVALAQISHYPVTDDTNGELQGILLEYDTAAKTIQFIGGEGVIVNNGSDALQTAYNQGDLHPWFWGLTCNTFI